MAKVKHFLSLKWQFFIFCLLLFIPLILMTSFLFHEHTKQVLIEREKASLMTSIMLISQQLSFHNIRSLSGKKKTEIESTQEYKDITKTLNLIKADIPEAEYIGVIRRNSSNSVEVIAYAGNESEALINNIKTVEQASVVPLIKNISLEVSEDNFIAAYGPIPDTPGAISVLYVNSKSLSDENNRFRNLFEKIFFTSLILLLFLSFFAAKVFVRPLKKLSENMGSISRGELKQKITSSWLQGETAELIESANLMNANFQSYKNKSEENIGQAHEKQKLTEAANQEIKNKNYQLNNTIITLNLINKLIEQLILVDDTQELMGIALPGTIDLIKARKGFIVEYIPEEKIYKVLTDFNTTLIEKDMSLPQKDLPALNRILDTKNSLNFDEPGNIFGEEYEAGLLFPLLVEKEIKGIMCILDKNDEEPGTYFEDEDETTVRTLSKLVAAAWESIHLFELATTDTLTKLFVRGYFEKNLEEEIRKSIRFNTKLSIIIFDIDNLLKINEKYGHETGDEIIKEVAMEIKRAAFNAGMAALYSSEKFIVYLSDSSGDDAYSVAEEIRESVSSIKPVSIENDDFQVTISAGISTMPENGKTSEKLIGDAEAALQKAKEEGKDRVILTSSVKNT